MLLAPLCRAPEQVLAGAAGLWAARWRAPWRPWCCAWAARDVEFDGKGVPRRERVPRLVEVVHQLDEANDGLYEVWMGAHTPPGIERAGRLGRPILLSGALPLDVVRVLTTTHREAWEGAGVLAAPAPAWPRCATCGSPPTRPSAMPCSTGSGRATCCTRGSAGPSRSPMPALRSTSPATPSTRSPRGGNHDHRLGRRGDRRSARGGRRRRRRRGAAHRRRGSAAGGAEHGHGRDFAEGVFPVLAEAVA